jgi:GTP cyclohydrolase III
MKYAYIDGDDIGLRIEKSILTNDEETLKNINLEVSASIEMITTYLLKSDVEVIFSGADGIICKSQEIDINALHAMISSMNRSISFSVGVGETLTECFLALRYAKANGKKGTAIFGRDFIWIPQRLI